MPREIPPEEKAWKEASSLMFSGVQELKKKIKGYSYINKESSVVTDERLCKAFTDKVSSAKDSIFSLSSLCFSLHSGEGLLPLMDRIKDEMEIFSDEIKVRHCHWRDIPPYVLRKIIKYDLSILKGTETLDKSLSLLYLKVLSEEKKGKPKPDFWKKVKKSLIEARSFVKELAILFKERETLCNIQPITLERTFRKIQEEIRSSV